MDDVRSNHRKKKAIRVNGVVLDMPSVRPGHRLNGGQHSLHRISEVRQREGVSLRSISRRWKMNVAELRELEDESSDLTLSQLYRWQAVLEVPVSELLVDLDQPLSPPVLRRAQMIRLMKTAMTLACSTRRKNVRLLVGTLMDQLTEIMPELRDVGPWQSNGEEPRPGHLRSAGGLTPHDDLDV